ncbi:hypothetical protein HMPREF1987_01597 [Peptostreptococcaceae bacterium oral taxon 113 str. W5053]|nr:hypothetical protein HMPREF1987_01597 [Peptostreptococcaceae bacterium oral taxon 113 str. W5053]
MQKIFIDFDMLSLGILFPRFFLFHYAYIIILNTCSLNAVKNDLDGILF